MSILFLDFEASGLDPASELPLEVGGIVTTDDLEEVVRFETLLSYEPDTVRALRDEADPVPRRMHDCNGLWADLENPRTLKVRLQDLDWWLQQAVLPHVPAPRGTPLAGFTPQFDRTWLQAYAPDFVGRLSHQHLDLSSCIKIFRAAKVRLPDRPEVPHRALGDCLSALDLARSMVQILEVLA